VDQPSQHRNVWILAVGEPLPIDGPDERLLRAGLLARCLVARGHAVTWWTSAFDHRRRRFRAQPAAFAYEGIRFRLLRGCGYNHNVSLKRIRDQRQVATEFSRRAPEERELPDVLFVAYPTVELAEAVIKFAHRAGRPVVEDVRDLWPDIFVAALPRALQPLGRLAVSGMKRQSARVLAGATAITGITQSFVDWGVSRAGRSLQAGDRSFPLAFDRLVMTPAELAEAQRSLASRGVLPRDGRLHFVFAGSLGKQFDFQPVFEAAAALRDAPVSFVIAGSGESERDLRQQAASLPNVTFVGWLDRSELGALLATATLGLAPYRSTWDFEASIPNKVIEYLASGLPVISSLRGEVASLLDRERCGLTYATDGGEALVTIVRALLADRARIAAMSSNARALFEQRFSGSDIYPAMADYLELIAQTGAGS
jgi:glycosyltransferase involved in cell wall biosynthesis